MVATAGQHDRVSRDDDHGGDRGPVGGEALDPAAPPQDGVASRGQLEEDDEHREERTPPAHRRHPVSPP